MMLTVLPMTSLERELGSLICEVPFWGVLCDSWIDFLLLTEDLSAF